MLHFLPVFVQEQSIVDRGSLSEQSGPPCGPEGHPAVVVQVEGAHSLIFLGGGVEHVSISVQEGHGGHIPQLIVGKLTLGAPEAHAAVVPMVDKAQALAVVHVCGAAVHICYGQACHIGALGGNIVIGSSGLQVHHPGAGVLAFRADVHQVPVLARHREGIGSGALNLGILGFQDVSFGILQGIAPVLVIVIAVEPGCTCEVIHHILGTASKLPAGVGQRQLPGEVFSVNLVPLLHNLIHGLIIEVHLHENEDAAAADHHTQQGRSAEGDGDEF